MLPESLRIVDEQGWLWKLLDFKTDNPDTAKAFAGMKAEMQRWLEEQIGARMRAPCQRKVQFFDKLGSLCRESSCRVSLYTLLL